MISVRWLSTGVCGEHGYMLSWCSEITSESVLRGVDTLIFGLDLEE